MKRLLSPALFAVAVLAAATIAVLIFDAHPAAAYGAVHIDPRGAIFAMSAGAGLDLEALSAEVKTALADLTKSSSEALAKVKAELADEKKEREALEMKLNRINLSGGGGNGAGGGIDTKALNDEREALGAFFKGDSSKLIEMKAMSVGSDPNGGYVVLPQMSSSMSKKLFDQSAMRRLARVVKLDSGDAFEEVVDKDEPAAEWVAEVQARNETGTPGLGLHRVPLHEIHASPKTTQKLLDTASIDVGAWLEGKVSDKFSRTEGVSFISGSGNGQPIGLLSGPTPVTTNDATRAWGTVQYFPSGLANGLAASNPADQLRNVVWGLRAPYRSGANWLMNSNTANAIDKIKSGTGEYIWRDGMTAGAPPSLLGYPVEFDESMPDLDTNTLPIAFGNFQLAYLIVELNALRLLRDPFTAKPNVVFYTYKRVGGDIDNSEAVKFLKCSVS